MFTWQNFKLIFVLAVTSVCLCRDGQHRFGGKLNWKLKFRADKERESPMVGLPAFDFRGLRSAPELREKVNRRRALGFPAPWVCRDRSREQLPPESRIRVFNSGDRKWLTSPSRKCRTWKWRIRSRRAVVSPKVSRTQLGRAGCCLFSANTIFY